VTDRVPHGPSRASVLVGAPFQVSQDLVKAALSGVSDSDLVAVLGTTLTAAGLDISTIEVARDAVDPERAQHFIRWRRNVDNTESNILAHDVFQNMLEAGGTVLRLNAESDPFAPVLQGSNGCCGLCEPSCA
jgi:hypothetical protein